MGKNPVWVSCDAVVTRCGHYVKLASKFVLFPGARVTPANKIIKLTWLKAGK